MNTSCPNWLRGILLFLTIASFIPQLHRIQTKKTSTGLSLFYILFNLLSTTEQFTLGFFITVNARGESRDLHFFAHNPRTLGDWLNLAQLSVDWVLFLLLFILSLIYPGPHRPIFNRIIAATIYTAFVFISIIPIFADVLIPTLFHEPDETDLNFGISLFAGWHFWMVNSLVTILLICSIIPQAIRLRSQLSSPSRSLGVVSIWDWALQSVVFAALAVSWIFRVNITSPGDVMLPFRDLLWYLMVGWAAGCSGIFAMIQGGLVVLEWHWRKSGREGVVGLGEIEPLLGMRE